MLWEHIQLDLAPKKQTAEDPSYEEAEEKYEDPNFDKAWESDDEETEQESSRNEVGETISQNDFVDEGELLPPADEGGKIPYEDDQWEEVE